MCSTVACCSQPGLLPSFPYAVKYNFPRCPKICPNWKYDAHLQDFCQKWGQFAPNLCQNPVNPYMDVHVPMCSFDKFSKPPLFQTSKCSTALRFQQHPFADVKKCCRPNCIPSAYNCGNPSPSSMINRRHYAEDVLCGNCPPPDYVPPRPEKPVNRCELEFPFEIYQCPEVKIEPIKLKSGAERCLHPSSMRYLATTNKNDFQDFYKLKSRKQVELYRSKYAIDHSRPRPTIPCNEVKDKVLSNFPIEVYAKCARWKGGNLRPTYDISIPNPMVVEPLEFSVGSLEGLDTKCRKMPVIC